MKVLNYKLLVLFFSLNATHAWAECNETCELKKIITIQQAEISNLKLRMSKNESTVKNVISEKKWIGDIAGLQGMPGANGTNGTNGVDGKTGPQGPAGDSIMAWRNGNNGTVSCQNYCERSGEVCVTAIIGMNTPASCSLVPGGAIHCLCSRR